MFSNVSPTWRRRLRVIVVVWALALVAAVPLASASTVSEQVPADEAAREVDSLIGQAAGYLSGDAFALALGPLEVEDCTVTPVRPGLSLGRTLMAEYAEDAAIDGLADRFDLVASRGEDARTWSGTNDAYVTLRLTETEPGVAQLRASTGCRPVETAIGTFRPAPPGGGDASWSYGAVDCAGGGRLDSWTTPSGEAPLGVEVTSGRCV